MDTVSIVTQGKDILSQGKTLAKKFLRALGLKKLSGPEVVERNLTLGLKNIGQDFLLNPTANKLSSKISVLRDLEAFVWAYKSKPNGSKVLVGPNFSAKESLYIFQNFPEVTFLAPSKEVEYTFETYGIQSEKIKLWPVGIDTHTFSNTALLPKTTDALVYFKRRKQEELAQVLQLLKEQKQSFRVLNYGSYSESEFIEAVRSSRYAVILDGTESQGIALQNIMSSNLPLFVFDQIYLGDSLNEKVKENLQVTSVPYWSEVCGIKVPTDSFSESKNAYFQIPEAKEKFQEFLKNINTYSPRSYIVENLSLEKQAKEFINLFN